MLEVVYGQFDMPPPSSPFEQFDIPDIPPYKSPLTTNATTTPVLLKAQDIYETGTITADGDVQNVVIVLRDSALAPQFERTAQITNNSGYLDKGNSIDI